MLRLSRLPNGEPEIFASIQGEGVTAGLPSVFIRLSLCNLRCVWCDTKYTWDWAHFDPKLEIVAVDVPEIMRRVEQTHLRNVVITGGEPLLQQRELIPLVKLLKSRGLRLEVETNGTIEPDPVFGASIDQWNVSPKLTNSTNRPTEREVGAAVAWFARQPQAYVKLVIADPTDLDEARELVDRYSIPADRVLLMPEATDWQRLVERSRWLAE